MIKTDSITSQGWLNKSNFDDMNQEIQMIIARKMALVVNAASIVLHSKWIRGAWNTVSDVCSGDHKLSGSEHIRMPRLLSQTRLHMSLGSIQLPA
jgi:hypothetical protein